MEKTNLSPEFKEWMKEKHRHPINAAKAHFIGYMEEYLAVKHGMGIGHDCHLYQRLHDGENFIDIRYDQLAREIESADKRKRFMQGE